MRELDAILLPFLEQHYDQLPANLQQRFAAWLELPDPILWNLLTSPSWVVPEDRELISLIFGPEGSPIA
jgi:succinate dehydrogenase flavin-adding protein (antitoxin of CptAB toxin-antitoxin module)